MKQKSLILAICFGFLLLNNIQVWATQEVRLVVNELKVFPVYNLQRVAVGDPEIADITILNDRELMLMAKRPGITNLIIWDEAGQRSFNITVLEKDLEKMAQRIRILLISSDIRGIRVKIEGGNIYVIGDVLTERGLDKIKDVLTPFTNVVNLVKLKERLPLVEIDVNVLEVAIDDLKELGFDWSAASPLEYSEPSTGESDIPKYWKVLRWDRSSVSAKLRFLITEKKARTLANPKLITLSGKEASFLVGGEVPYITVTSGTVLQTQATTYVEWKEYGVNLKIEPLVNAKNEIRVKIKAEVSDLDKGSGITFQGYEIPGVKKREAETEVFLNEGDTIFLAGLIKNDDSRNVQRLPWLSKVPILGELFKSTDFIDKRTELVISLTPRIIGEKASPEFIAQEMLTQETILAAQRRFPAYSEEASPLAYYSHMIEDIISSRVVYPLEAKEEQQEGIVKIDLYLFPDGKLKEAKIKESSGFSSLDEAALSVVEELAPYPSFPSAVTQKELRLTVPVVFKSYVRND